jgi:hypothetical protein
MISMDFYAQSSFHGQNYAEIQTQVQSYEEFCERYLALHTIIAEYFVSMSEFLNRESLHNYILQVCIDR